MLRAHESRGRLGRGRHSRLRHRLPRRVAGEEGRARHAPHLGEALHHARAGRDFARTRVSALRSAAPAWRRARARHHARPDPDLDPGRPDRAPPPSAQCGVHERSELGQGRVHPARPCDRRGRIRGSGLAHADELPRCRALDLAARQRGRHRQAVRVDGGRLRARAHAVQAAGREVRRRRGGACAHRRQHLHDGRRTRDDRGRARPRRKALGGLGDRQVPLDRARPPHHQRCDGRARRQGHLHGAVELPGERLSECADRHHGRGRKHPHALDDHLRPGSDTRPSLGAEGDGSDPRNRSGDGAAPIRCRRASPSLPTCACSCSADR